MIPLDQKRPHLIQIVDDDPAMRLLTRATLEYAGFAVIEATDGTVALSQFRKCARSWSCWTWSCHAWMALPPAVDCAVCPRARKHPLSCLPDSTMSNR